jgi:hypothetical protein
MRRYLVLFEHQQQFRGEQRQQQQQQQQQLLFGRVAYFL